MWRQELDEKGYVVIPNILTKQQCASYIRRIRHQFHKAVAPEDETTFLTREADNGVVHGLDNLRVLWEVRTHPDVRSIFQNLYPDTDLYLYVDRFNYRPPHVQHQFQEGWHIDEQPDNPQSNYQAFISLTSSSEHDDCLGILEKSHQCLDRFFEEFPRMEAFLPEHHEWLKENGCVERRVECPAGSLVLWDSRCFHTPLNSRRKRPHTRLVVYVRYFPSSRFPQDQRLQIFKTYPQYTTKGLQLVSGNDPIYGKYADPI